MIPQDRGHQHQLFQQHCLTGASVSWVFFADVGSTACVCLAGAAAPSWPLCGLRLQRQCKVESTCHQTTSPYSCTPPDLCPHCFCSHFTFHMEVLGARPKFYTRKVRSKELQRMKQLIRGGGSGQLFSGDIRNDHCCGAAENLRKSQRAETIF